MLIKMRTTKMMIKRITGSLATKYSSLPESYRTKANMPFTNT